MSTTSSQQRSAPHSTQQATKQVAKQEATPTVRTRAQVAEQGIARPNIDATGPLQTAAAEVYAARAEAVTRHTDEAAVDRLLGAAARAPTVAKRLLWLRRAADTVGAAVGEAAASPCRKGCASCCRIPVAVSRPEAQAIAAALGVALPAGPVRGFDTATALGADDNDFDSRVAAFKAASAVHLDVPCPFLRDSSCSIYDLRPLACRYHFSLADDAEPCELVDAGKTAVEVPYLRTLPYLAASSVILGCAQDVADIRDWFAQPLAEGAEKALAMASRRESLRLATR